jgi:MFS family permease
MHWHLGLGRQVGLAFWGTVCVEAAFGSYMGVWPLWIEHLGAPVTIVGLVLGASGIVRLFVLLPSAALAERFPVRTLVVAARVAALLGLVSAALATHWTHLGLMVVGAAVGTLPYPLIQSHVARHTGANRVRSFTLVFTVGPSIALATTPLIAGLLVGIAGLRAAFVLGALFAVASIACFSRLPRRETARSDSQAEGSSYRSAVGDSAIRRLLILQGTTIFSLALGTSLVPNFLQDERGLTAATVSSLGALAAVGSILFGLVVTRAGRLQRAPYLATAIAVGSTAVGFGLFLSSDSLPLIGLAFIFRGGLFSAWALFAAAIGEQASAANRARSFALSEMIGGLCFSLAPVAAGPLFALNPAAPLSLAATLALALAPTLLIVQLRAIREPARVSVELPSATRDAQTAPADAPIA